MTQDRAGDTSVINWQKCGDRKLSADDHRLAQTVLFYLQEFKKTLPAPSQINVVATWLAPDGRVHSANFGEMPLDTLDRVLQDLRGIKQ